MDLRDDHRAIAHRRYDTLCRDRAHVADNEDAPTARRQGVVRAGQHKALVVQVDARPCLIPLTREYRRASHQTNRTKDGAGMAVPSPYQVIILGPGEPAHAVALRVGIQKRVAELGDDVSALLVFLGPSTLLDAVATGPLVAVFLGGDTTTDAAGAADLVARSVPVLPVVADIRRFSSLTPPALRPVNGMEVDWNAPDFTEVVNLVLENLLLLRRTRRLFLSYLRAEATQAAHQLRVAFDDAGYDAFLDTSSVPKGDDFQAVLWHRLLDSEVLVVLATPNFNSSDWTRKEVAQALAMSVGILRVVWPTSPEDPKGELAVQFHLVPGDFSGDQLEAQAVKRIVAAAEELRARCIAARHTNLVTEFCEEAAKAGATTAVQPERYVLASLADGRRIAAIPAVGVPDANRYHETSGRFPAAGHHADSAVLLYDHRGMTPAWAGFLDWLDEHLPVRGLRVTETAAKLGR